MTKRRANRPLVTAKQKKRAGLLVLLDPFQRRVRESKRCAKIRRRHISRQTAIAQWSVDAEKRGDRQGSLLETKKQAVAFLPEGNLESILLIPSSNRGKAKPCLLAKAGGGNASGSGHGSAVVEPPSARR